MTNKPKRTIEVLLPNRHGPSCPPLPLALALALAVKIPSPLCPLRRRPLLLLTQDTFASTTTPTLELLSLKQPPLKHPPRLKVRPSETAAAASSAAPDAIAAGDASSDNASSSDDESPVPAALKEPPAPKPPVDTAVAAAA
eukprot:CAMPEP_0168172358 /NCGR_PEP_ID=MMETSP0139_2-20121125/5199_1 /TAXON_ID=44445 /ORGANISM="Pseudo-nitzschia australis, Strain 10249 10 AB" /LENGTH=140 /DNA_ID=CAMNT_0008089979 /DNA_START=166 /DNA_END=586 /DNA_ORIENTATION=+